MMVFAAADVAMLSFIIFFFFSCQMLIFRHYFAAILFFRHYLRCRRHAICHYFIDDTLLRRYAA